MQPAAIYRLSPSYKYLATVIPPLFSHTLHYSYVRTFKSHHFLGHSTPILKKRIRKVLQKSKMHFRKIRLIMRNIAAIWQIIAKNNNL